jgi:hypothetical protein
MQKYTKTGGGSKRADIDIKYGGTLGKNGSISFYVVVLKASITNEEVDPDCYDFCFASVNSNFEIELP